MKILIVVLTKSPHRFRFGPTGWWDWKVQCRKAAILQKKFPSAVVFVSSAVHIAGYLPELDYYRLELARNGLYEGTVNRDGEKVLLLERRGQETIEQLECAFALAAEHRVRIIVSLTVTHFLRALYLCRKKNVRYSIAIGIPSFREAISDILLSILFPFVDFFGFRQRFQERVICRRESGKH